MAVVLGGSIVKEATGGKGGRGCELKFAGEAKDLGLMSGRGPCREECAKKDRTWRGSQEEKGFGEK